MGSKERRERERQATQQDILQAALEIAIEENWQAMTIRRIAERIEYSPSAIYKYFADKEAILFSLLRQGFQELLTSLEYIMSREREPEARLLQATMAYWDFAQRNPTLYQLMYDLKGIIHEAAEAKAVFLMVRAALEEWSQANAVSMVDLNGAVDILWATMHGIVALTMVQYIYGGPTRSQALFAQAVSDLLLAWKTRAHSAISKNKS